jgi:hypothetical protein
MALDAPPQEVEALIDTVWVIQVFSGDRRNPIAAKTFAASSRSASASAWEPATASTQSSANRISRY